MKAFIHDRYGSALRFGDMPDPELRDDEALVQIHAAGINPVDSKIRDGEFKLILPAQLPRFWAMTWPVSCFGSARVCGDSSPAMKSMPVRRLIALAPSRT